LNIKPYTSVPLMTDLRSLTLVEGGACHDRSRVVFEAFALVATDTAEAKEKRAGNEYR
jgi:hypothetical protein